MAKANTRRAKPRVRTPLDTTTTPDARTYTDAPAYTKNLHTEWFALASTNFVGEDTAYETGDSRTERFFALTYAIAPYAPLWLAAGLAWLRGPGNMRGAPLRGAIAYGRALDDLACAGPPATSGTGGMCSTRPARYFHADTGRWTCKAHARANGVLVQPRNVLSSTLQRADEPGEAVAVWTTDYGRKMPKWFKRGVADASIRLWTEYAASKWDKPEAAWRMADVIELCHPGDRRGSRQRLRDYQRALFPWLIETRHGRPSAKSPSNALPMLAERAALFAVPVADRRKVLDTPERLALAGMTHETLGGWLQGPMDAKAWEAIIPTMRYQALLMNLRNFDQAGVSPPVASAVALTIADPEQVTRAGLFPFQFLSAYLAVDSDRWRPALGEALDASVRNVPALPGRTLVVVDASDSMTKPMSERSTATRWQTAALFAMVLAAARPDHTDVVAFGALSAKIDGPGRGGSVLRAVERFGATYMIGHGSPLGHHTFTRQAVATHYAGHDRVIILTDDQPRDGDPGDVVPPSTPLFLVDVVGYRAGAMRVGPNRHLAAGLTDATFGMIRQIERGRDAQWPWEVKA